jgi:hypothetical protein
MKIYACFFVFLLSFLQYYISTMQSARKPVTEAVIKRHKINTCSKILTDEDMEEGIQTKKTKITPKQRPMTIPQPSRDHLSPSVTTTSSSSSHYEAPCVANADDYVIVKLIPKGRKSCHPAYYVGYVSAVDGEVFTIQCMRRYNMSINSFVFPEKEDFALYSVNDIVTVLRKPKVSRQIYYFPNNFTPYSNGLH